MPNYRLLKLGTPSQPTPDVSEQTPVTKSDFKQLKEGLIWPPTFNRDPDLLKALEMKTHRDSILDNNSLSLPEKLRLLEQADRLFMLFKRKADDNPGQKNLTALSSKPSPSVLPDSDISARVGGSGVPMEINDITDSFTKNQKVKARSILRGLQRIGDITWTNKGELYNPATETIIPGSDIQSLVRYLLIPNKVNTPKPKGFEVFKKATNRFEDLLPSKPAATVVKKRKQTSSAQSQSKAKRANLFTDSDSETDTDIDYKTAKDETDTESETDSDPDTTIISRRGRNSDDDVLEKLFS